MFTLWKWSTIFFVLQLIAAAITYTEGGAGAVIAAAGPIFVFIVIIMWLAFVVRLITNGNESRIPPPLAVLTLAAATSAITAAPSLGADPLTNAMIVLILMVAFHFVIMSIHDEDEEWQPYWAKFVAALPLGIGTVVGGALYYFFFRRRSRRRKREWSS